MSDLTMKLARLYDYDKGDLERFKNAMETRQKELPNKIERIADLTGIDAAELVSLAYKTDGPTFRWYDMIDRLWLMFNYRHHLQTEQVEQNPVLHITNVHGVAVTMSRDLHILLEGTHTFREFTCDSLASALRLYEALQHVTQFT